MGFPDFSFVSGSGVWVGSRFRVWGLGFSVGSVYLDSALKVVLMLVSGPFVQSFRANVSGR